MDISLQGFQCRQYCNLKTENDHDVKRPKDCMKKFCEPLREQAMKIINLEKMKIKLLTKEWQESHENAKICYIGKEKFEDK